MAIEIITEPTGHILHAFNNSVLEFKTTAGVPARAVLNIGGYNFEITPNNNVFFFNMKEIVKVLINQDNFKDSVSVVNPLSYIYADDLMYKEIDTNITVFTKDGSTFQKSKKYNYLKSVKQIVAPNYQEAQDLKILSPSIDSNKTVTYFEGLPFDVSIFSDTDKQINLKHARNQHSVNINLKKGVNRLFISNGENDNGGFESVLPLFIGLNKIEIRHNNVLKSVLYIKKNSVACGVYLKYFNQSGGWSYWRCLPTYRASLKTKALQELNNDNFNIDNAINRALQTGKSAMQTQALKSGIINKQEQLVLSQIFASPKVFLYNNIELQPFQLSDWKEVRVTDNNKEIYNTKNMRNAYDINIELPQLYTQSYAG